MSAIKLHRFADHSATHLPQSTAAGADARKTPAPGMVVRQLAEILPALALAHEKGMAWLADFADDPIQISTDLDEVIQAFQDFCMD